MAKLPQASDLSRRKAPAASPGISVPGIDYGAARAGTNALARGLESVSGALEFKAKQGDELEDYETRKKLLDFRLETEMALEDYKRSMPPGGTGYTDGWMKEYRSRAKAFVGKEDANIKPEFRGKVGYMLKEHESSLHERARREEIAEQDRTELEGLEGTLGVTRSFVEADPSRRDEMRLEGEGLIDRSRLSPAQKDATKKKFSKELSKTAIVTRIMKAQSADDYTSLMQDLAPEAPDRRTSSVVTDKITTGKTGKAAGWAATNPMWQGLDPFQKAAAMALLEADAANISDARNALGAMINRAAKTGENLGAHVSQAIYQPTIEPAQERRLSRVLVSPQFEELTQWAKRRADGQEADPVAGATHFLASEKTMLALEASDPKKYRSWRKWTNFDGKEYRGVKVRDGSHAFLAPDGDAETAPQALGQEGTYGGPYADLTLPERKALWEQAVVQRKKAIAEVEKEITSLEGNAVLGYALPVPMMEDLGKKVAATGDGALMARHESAIVLAKVFSEAQKRSPAENEANLQQLRAYYARNAPTPANMEILKKFEGLVSSQRGMVQDDKLTWAYRSGSTPVGPLDFNDDDSMKTRLEHAGNATLQFGGPIQYFTKAERDSFAAKLKAGGDGLINMTARMVQTWGPEHTTRAMNEISDKVPEAAVAGYLLANDINPKAATDIAATLKRRQDPNYRPQVLTRSTADPIALEVLNDVYRNFPPQQRDSILTAADAIYEARVAGKAEDPEIYKQAIKDVIGQRRDVNGNIYGGPVSKDKGWLGGYSTEKMFLLPSTWRSDTWKDTLEIATTRDLMTAGMLPPTDARGAPLSMTRIANASLVQIGPGQYHVAIGDPDEPGNEQWVMTAPMPRQPRRPFVLDLNRLEGVLRPRVPGAFWQK